MNYFKQGDAANAYKIKAAFEKLGIDVSGMSFCNDYILFFTYDLEKGGKVITTTSNDLCTAHIIKTHPDYKELELPVGHEFKAGDWLVYKDGETFCGGLKTVQVQTVEKDRYVFTHGTCSTHRFIDSTCRLWSIQDAKDGDVLATTKCPFIYRKTGRNNDLAYYYACVDCNGDFCEGCIKRTLYHFGPVEDVAPATKEQRDMLFAKMKEAGYEWDADKKELRKIQPHYDIANFHAGMPVLVRDYIYEEWRYVQFSHMSKLTHALAFNAGCQDWYQCIPFNDDTKQMLGTTDMPSEEYINW